MRPPTVRRRSGAPSFGQCAPGSRCEVRSPVWDPPRRPRMRSVSLIARCSRRVSSVVSVSATRAGSIPARHSTSSHEQVAESGDPGLVHQHRLDRRAAPRRHGARARRASARTRRGRARSSSGSSSTAPEPARVAEEQAPAVGEVQPEAVPRALGRGCSRRRSGSPAASPSTSTRPLMPRCRPRTAPDDVSTSMSLPRRRACDERGSPQRRAHGARGVRPRLRNHVSGAYTCAIGRSSARASISARAASTSRISGKCAASVSERTAGQTLVIAPLLGALGELGVLGEEAARVARLGQLPVRAALVELGVVDEEVDRVRARRRSRCGRRRRRTRSARRRPPPARRARHRTRACRPRSGRR